ncbi:hypothetical protein BDR06DRAFT_356609 [Suillus hirtellus]|nr:hypothetical protein BDR06DRAFT_356609 [Suillus hirtellus]
MKIMLSIQTQDTPLKDSRSRDPVLSNIVHEVTSSVPNTEDSRSCDPVLPKVDCEGASSVPNTEVQDSSLGMEQYAYIRAALQDADKAANDMNLLPGPMKSGTRITQNAPADIEDAYNNYLQPLKIFDTVIGALANVHPYAKIALGGLSGAAKIVLAQADRDEAMLSLLKKLKDVYDFISDSERLRQISSMRTVLGNISQQTLECAHFIRDYSKIKSFWKRTGKNLVRETDDAIQRYSKVLDDLMDNFQTQVALDTNISVHRIVETMQLSGITYAEGAGLITEKQCLFETRRRTLSEITDWANSTGGDGSRVLWLSGPAGRGWAWFMLLF